MIDGNTALKFEYSNFLKIEINETVENYRANLIPKNKVLETFKRIDKLPFGDLNIRFSDNVWDFSSATSLPIPHYKLVFNFNGDSAYVDIIKMFVLNEIIKKKSKMQTIHDRFWMISKCLDFFESQGYCNIPSIPKTVISRFFEKENDQWTYQSCCRYKTQLLSFFNFYEISFEELNDKSIKSYLKEKNTSLLNEITEAGKTPEIPVEYLPIFIDGVKTIMRDVNEKKEDRIMAASIILFSQIGFRTSEFLTVKINSLSSVWSPDKQQPLYYMEFKSFKHGTGDNAYTLARTYMNALSCEAYNLLNDLCKEKREQLKTDSLFVCKSQLGDCYTSRGYAEKYRVFVMRHWKELQCLNIGDEYEDLQSFDVMDYFKPKKDGTYQYSRKLDWSKDLKPGDRIYYPALRQFRVSVCTSLYRQQIPLHYIRKHMNHLSEDMTSYYIRPQKNIEKEYSETVYRAVFKDGSKMLGKNGDAFIKKINEFIEANNFNVQDDIESVIKMVAKRFPLRSKVGGMCIRCGDVIPCASNNSTDEIYCAFGMCQNHCHMFFMADISYEEYLRHKDIVEYNQANNFTKAYQKERNKLLYYIEHSLLPELEALGEELQRHGENEIIDKYPQLTYIVNHYEEINQEVLAWMQKK